MCAKYKPRQKEKTEKWILSIYTNTASHIEVVSMKYQILFSVFFISLPWLPLADFFISHNLQSQGTFIKIFHKKIRYLFFAAKLIQSEVKYIGCLITKRVSSPCYNTKLIRSGSERQIRSAMRALRCIEAATLVAIVTFNGWRVIQCQVHKQSYDIE